MTIVFPNFGSLLVTLAFRNFKFRLMPKTKSNQRFWLTVVAVIFLSLVLDYTARQLLTIKNHIQLQRGWEERRDSGSVNREGCQIMIANALHMLASLHIQRQFLNISL